MPNISNFHERKCSFFFSPNLSLRLLKIQYLGRDIKEKDSNIFMLIGKA